jgi:hypothetical protein
MNDYFPGIKRKRGISCHARFVAGQAVIIISSEPVYDLCMRMVPHVAPT